MAGERWLFTQEQLATTPSRQCGIDAEKEKCYRQQAANFMQEMGQRLTVSQLCINTGIVYLHRFYMFQSFTKFHRNSMAQACLFLAAKVEEQPRKLEHVIKVAHMILHRDQAPLDTKSVAYLDQAQELVVNENILLQTLGFELQVDHPHAHIVKTCNLIKAPKDLTQTSYFLATNSLHLTLMSLRYKPTFVACVCIHLACKWAKFRIPRSSAGKEWWYYVDKDMTSETLEEITQGFLAILDKCPSKFKKKLVSKSAKDEDFFSLMQFPQEKKPKSEATATITKDSYSLASSPPSTSLMTAAPNHEGSPQVKANKPPSPALKPEAGAQKAAPLVGADSAMRRVKTESYLTSLTTKEYFERKERERKERERIEKDRQKMIERKEASLHPEQAGGQLAGDADAAAKQHTNIFDQIIGEKMRSESLMDVVDSGTSVRAKHSIERSHVQHNYKERYHHKDKLPFSSPEPPKEQQQQQQVKSGSHRPPPLNQRAMVASAAASAAAAGQHQVREQKQKARVYDRRHPEHKAHALPGKEQVKREPVKSLVQDVRVSEDSPEKVAGEEKLAKIDPEEGEILDDDSPLGIPTAKGEKAAVNQRDDRGGHHYHHRERRTSGRHQSPAASQPPGGHLKAAQPPDGRVRHRSPRGAHAPPKDDPQPPAVAREHKASAPKYEVIVPEPTTKLPDIETLHSKTLEELSLAKQATPEPGEIVEHGQKHHRKSSRSKAHKKDRHRDREPSHDAGSLKIRLDLKGMGAVPSAAKAPPATTTAAPGSGDERKKEIRVKIKPPAVIGSGDGKEAQEANPGLKMKLKVAGKFSPIRGNGESARLEPKELHKSSNAIKLTLSKDSQSGQFTAHGSVHRPYKHGLAPEKAASRKRTYSPSEAPATHQKVARNDGERHHGNELPAVLVSDGAASSSPLLAHPALVEDVQRQLHRLIEKKTEEIQQQKLVSGKRPHHDGVGSAPSIAFPPTEPTHSLPDS